MPFNEYRCEVCGALPTIFTKAGTKPRCPECGSERLIWAPRTAPAIACHGCPSYVLRRQASEEENRRIANKKMQDRNRDEIQQAARTKWKVLDERTEERDRETERSVGLAEGANAKLKAVRA